MGNVTIKSDKVIKTSIDNRSTLFTINNVGTIAISLDYLFRITEDKRYQLEVDDITSSIEKDRRINTTYSDTIQRMILNNGCQHEYYKNSKGFWVNMDLIKRNIKSFSYIKDSNILVNNTRMKPYLIGDYLDGNSEEPLIKMYFIKNTSIPLSKFIDTEGFVYNIHHSDGKSSELKYEQEFFNNTGVREFLPVTETIPLVNGSYDIASLVKDKRPSFKIVLCNHAQGLTSVGNDLQNNSHLLDDIKLSFTKSDGTNYTDLSDMLIFVNGMCLNYFPDPNSDNSIFILDVVKFARFHNTGIKSNINLDDITIINNGDVSSSYKLDITNGDKVYKYIFDVKIYKWKDIKISNRIVPINTYKELKTEENTNQSHFLTTSLIFSKDVDYNKMILLRDSEIVSKSEFTVDNIEKNVVHLTSVSAEFDILMTEIRTMLDEYMNENLHVKPPQAGDYINFEEYIEALDAFMLEVGIDHAHGVMSAIKIVRTQFANRTYSIIKFDNTDSDLNDLHIYENEIDVTLDSPYKNHIKIENYDISDILIFNGFNRRIENIYGNVFKFPLRNYQYDFDPNDSSIFAGAKVYKLQILKDHKVI